MSRQLLSFHFHPFNQRRFRDGNTVRIGSGSVLRFSCPVFACGRLIFARDFLAFEFPQQAHRRGDGETY